MQESPSAKGFHSEITGMSLLLTWTESQSLRLFRLFLQAVGLNLQFRHDIMSHSPFCGFWSAGIIPLAPWRVLLGQTPDPPSGPSTGPNPPSVLQACWSWWEEHKVLQRNPSLKWNISACSFVVLTNTPSSSINNLFLYVMIIWNLNPLSSLPSFGFFNPLSVLLCLYFWLIYMFFTLQFSATPVFYSSVSSPSLWERPKVCKQPLIYSRLDLTLHTVRTYWPNQQFALEHCPRFWVCVTANSAKLLTHTHMCFILTPKVLLQQTQRCKTNNRAMTWHDVSTEGSVRGTLEPPWLFSALQDLQNLFCGQFSWPHSNAERSTGSRH